MVTKSTTFSWPLAGHGGTSTGPTGLTLSHDSPSPFKAGDFVEYTAENGKSYDLVVDSVSEKGTLFYLPNKGRILLKPSLAALIGHRFKVVDKMDQWP